MEMDEQSRVKVLLIEERADDAERLREMLASVTPIAFEVEWVDGLERALQRLTAGPIDVILFDLSLSKDDVAGLSRLQAQHPGVPVIVLTAYEDDTLAVKVMQRGAQDYLIKGQVDRQMLARSVRYALERKRGERVKDEFVNTVSHELRTPLATIKEFTAILSDQIAGPVTAAQREYLSIITANVERLSRMIDQLLDMAKIDAGRVLLTKETVEVVPLLEQILQMMRPLAQGKQLTIQVTVPEGLTSVFADPDSLTQVLINLVSNAIKFTAGPGRVLISVEDQPNETQFNVTDTGIGIAPEHFPKLFEKFQQFPSVTSTGAMKGTGLGLAISKRLVELHGGRIWAKSTSGEGSTFAFTVPKYQPEEVFREQIRSGIEEARQQHHCFSILVVTLVDFPTLKTRYGLEESTRLLRTVEGLLRSAIRRSAGDVIIRWQRGELLVLLRAVPAAGARRIAGRLKRLVEARPVPVPGGAVTIPVVTATATYPEEGLTEAELLQLTERRLQRGDAPPTRVLVVDDEPKIRQFLKEVLELREYTVTTAASGPEALEALKRHPVECILLDVMMPVMDGYELYHLLKEDPATQAIPVIIVTAKGERKDRELGLAVRAPYAYVTKPFQLDELIATLQQVLQRQGATPTAPARSARPRHKEVAHGPDEEDPHRG